jgi:RimJ/RimL family protein N-acetyltransferase
MAAPAQTLVHDTDVVAQTVRLTLRWPQSQDSALWAAYLGDFDVSKMLARVPFPYTAEDVTDWLARVEANRASGDAVNCVIMADMLVGGISIHDIAKREAVLGYWIAKPYWRRGFAIEAARAMTRYAFDELGLSALRAGYFEENERSWRILNALGFEETGRSMWPCRARDTEVRHVDLRLTQQRWRELQ